MLTKAMLKDAFSNMGVAPGKVVLVHSSFNSLGPVEGGPVAVIEALLEAVGPEGTALWPTFNFQSWTEAHYFDLQHTPSAMGILSEMARLDPRFERTLHPIYSWVVAGRMKEAFIALDSENCYGPGSVFDLIHRTDAIMISLGLHLNSTFSLTHHVEKMSGACGYRYDKPFSGIYVGRDGAPALKTYTMTVRDLLRGVQTNIVAAMTKLIEDGVISEHRINETVCHSAGAKAFFDALIVIVREHPEMLHHYRWA